MAKPRVFISSTFYDLRQIRVELDKFIGVWVMNQYETRKGIYHTERMKLFKNIVIKKLLMLIY